MNVRIFRWYFWSFQWRFSVVNEHILVVIGLKRVKGYSIEKVGPQVLLQVGIGCVYFPTRATYITLPYGAEIYRMAGTEV